MGGVLGFYEIIHDVTWVAAQLRLRFQVGNVLHENNENIEYLNISPCFWEYNGLLNNSYCDDLDSIDQNHSKGNVLHFYLYLGYPENNFNKIVSTMIASRSATKMSSSDLKT